MSKLKQIMTGATVSAYSIGVSSATALTGLSAACTGSCSGCGGACLIPLAGLIGAGGLAALAKKRKKGNPPPELRIVQAEPDD